MRPIPIARAALALALSLAAPLTLANVSTSLVRSSAQLTEVRIDVGTPAFTRVDTPSGPFSRFVPNQAGLGSTRSGPDARGMPELPTTGFPVALPLDLPGAPVVRVLSQGPQRSLQLALYPVQRGETANADDRTLPPFEFDAVRYRLGGATPGQAMGSKPLFRGDARVDSLRFMPYGYEPATGLLTWHDSYLVTVEHAAGACFQTDHLADPRTVAAFDGIDQHLQRQPLPMLKYAINPLQLASTCASLQVAPNLNGARFIIVSHPSFLAAANTLRAHKEAMGISTLVVSTQTIAGPSAAGVNAVQIRNWLANYYDTHTVKPKWLLLLGDAERIPTNYDEVNSWNSARNASDIWYGQFLPGAGPETVPAIGIGRFPVDSAAQAETMVAKVIAFENFPPAASGTGPGTLHGFYSRLTFASFFEGPGTKDERWFAEVTEKIRDHAVDQGFSVRRIYKAESAANPLKWRSALG